MSKKDLPSNGSRSAIYRHRNAAGREAGTGKETRSVVVIKSAEDVAVASLRSLRGQELAKTICEALLGLDERQRNPVNILKNAECENWVSRLKDLYEDLAKMILKSITPRPSGAVSELERDDGYLSLKEYLETYYSCPFEPWLSLENLTEAPSLELILHHFFTIARSGLDRAILSVCRLINQGVPLYTQCGDEFNRVRDDHVDVIYLSQKYQYRETNAAGRLDMECSLPEWAGKYSFSRKDLVIHRTFFGCRTDFGLEATAALREAYRRMLGVQGNSSGSSCETVTGSHEAPLLVFVNQVLSRNCPGLFDGRDGGWPKQEDVQRWLMTNCMLNGRKLSGRQAEAVALVTQPK